MLAKLNCRGLGPVLSTDWLRVVRLYVGNILLMLVVLFSKDVVAGVVGVAVVGALVDPPVNEDNENCAGAGTTAAPVTASTAIIGNSLRTLCLPLASCQRIDCNNLVPRGEHHSVRADPVKLISPLAG